MFKANYQLDIEMLHLHECLSPEDLDYIQSIPDVLLAKEKLAVFENNGSVYFKITLTEGLKSTLSTRLGLDLSSVTEIPMRWIKGDTVRHADQGESDFTNTYLVYLTDSSGEFVLDDMAFPIQKNQGFVFSEGILHETMNTGSMPRLLLGPMNEFAQPVGFSVALQSIYYYSSQSGAEAVDISDNTAMLDNSLGISSTYTVGDRDAVFKEIVCIASDNSGNLFVGMNNSPCIRKITPNGVVSTFAGNKDIGGFADGPTTDALFQSIFGIAVHPDGSIYVSDSGNHRIRKIDTSGNVTTVAGNGNTEGGGGAGTIQSIGSATFNIPQGITLDSLGNIIVCDCGNSSIRVIEFSSGLVKTIAGGNPYGYSDGPASISSFRFLTDVNISADGLFIYVADPNNCAIRRISLSVANTYDLNLPSEVVTVGGLGGEADAIYQGYVDGFYPDSRYSLPISIAIHPDSSSGNQILVADTGNTRLRLIQDPIVSAPKSFTIAGIGTSGFTDGIGLNAAFNGLKYLTFDPSGNLIIADYYRIRKISAATVTTVAGGDVSTLYGLAGYGYKDTNVALPTNNWKIASSSTGSSSQVVIWTNGQTLDASGTYFLYPMPSGSVCFLEGTTVLCFLEGKEQYVPVEKLTKGTLVRTLRDGYKKVELIAKEEMSNPGTDERIEQRLYKCSTSRYPELTSDLYLTGCHSILVDTITDNERAQLIKHLDRIFVTDKKYRLIACVDERAEPWNSEGTYTVWHFALEHENIKMNYGVFVNGGLLVESCSKHVLTNKSNMVLQ